MDRVRRRIGIDKLNDVGKHKTPVTVAVLDSGISNHPDLLGKCMLFHDFINGQKNVYDDSGHGTHVCGILCGSGEASRGKYRGVAPCCRLVVCKILDKRGNGSAEVMLKALKWILLHKQRYDIRLVNISVGIGKTLSHINEEKLRELLESLWDAGIIVICSAGNNGPNAGSISYMGSSSKVITVGCYDDLEPDMVEKKNCEWYSGRGNINDQIRKPDLVAPGSGIVSCCHRVNWKAGKFHDIYEKQSGTSMATPIITGCAALLLQSEPYLNNKQVRERLCFSAEDLGIAWNRQGWGMINVKNLLEIR